MLEHGIMQDYGRDVLGFFMVWNIAQWKNYSQLMWGSVENSKRGKVRIIE